VLTVVPYEGIVPIIVSHEAITALTTLLPVEEVVEEAPAPSSWGWKEVGLVVLGVVIVVAWAHYCGYLNWGPKNSSSEGVQVVEKVVEGTLNPTPEVVEGVKAVRPSVSTSGARGLSLNQPRTSRAPAGEGLLKEVIRRLGTRVQVSPEIWEAYILEHQASQIKEAWRCLTQAFHRGNVGNFPLYKSSLEERIGHLMSVYRGNLAK
jgi:hypothetical protein